MPGPRRLHLLAYVIAAGTCGLASASVARRDQSVTDDERSEPPLEFFLEHAGKSMPVRLDESVHLETESGPVDLTLRMKATRTLRVAGVSFEYPNSFGF